MYGVAYCTELRDAATKQSRTLLKSSLHCNLRRIDKVEDIEHSRHPRMRILTDEFCHSNPFKLFCELSNFLELYNK